MANNNKMVDLNKIARLAEALDSRMDNKVATEESRAKEVEADLQQSISDTQAMIGGKSIVYITQAEYDLLSEEEKNDDTKIYFVVDAADSTHNHENKDFLDSLNEEDYLQMGADITSLKNNKLNASVYNDGIAEVKGLIEDEEERATGIEAQLQSAIDGKAPTSHTHDDLYYTETEIDGKIEDINEAIEGRAPSVHTHTVLSMKADNFKAVNDAPSTYERGETLFFANAPTDRFNNLQYGLVQTLKEYSSGNAAWQFLYPYNDKTDTFYVRNGQYEEDGWRSWAEVYTSLNKPTATDIGAAPTTHSHNDLYYTETEIDGKIGTINTALNGKAATGHTHDDRYYTESEINGKINVLNEADANLQAIITSEVGKVDAKLGGKSFVYLTQADYDILTDEQKGDTSKIYVITDATDLTHTHSNKAYLDTLAAPTVVQVNPSGTILTLTTDKYQKTTIVDGTQIVFPTVDNFTEIHLYFDAETAMSLTFPDCRWRVDPNIEAGKSYEIVATYNTIRWLVNVIVYSSDDDMDPIIWYDNKEIYSDTGTMETADGYISSDFVSLEENKDYQITVLNNTDTEIHCYDDEKNYLSDLDVSLTDYGVRVYSLRKMFDMDDMDISNTKYIRIETEKNKYINATNANEKIIIEEIDTLEDNQVPLIIFDDCTIDAYGARDSKSGYIAIQHIVLDNYFNYQFEFLGSDSTVNYYDEGENFISRDTGENNDYFDGRQVVLNSDDFPEGTKFVRIRFEKNDTITFENIHEYLKVTKTPVVSENIMPLNWIENTNLYATTGKPYSKDANIITDFIEIDDSYYYTITLDEPDDVKEYYYNSNKEFISRSSYNDISTGNEVLEFPEGTKYIRLKSDIDEYTIDVVKERIILRKFLKEENFLYSFGLLSDVHIDNNHDADYEDKSMSIKDYKNALRFLEDEGANFIAYCGDMTKNHKDSEADYQMVAECLKKSHIPNYIIKGNHDAGTGYFDEYVSGISRFTVPYKDDLFIFVGNGSTTGTNGGLSQSRIDYIRSIIEDNPDRRLFLMYHQFIRGYGSGDGTGGLYSYATLGDDPNNALTNEFIELVTSTPNLIFCHGHSHIRFNVQDTCPTANYYHADGECHDIHVPSCARPRVPNESGGLDSYFEGSEGYIVDVYSDKVIFKAIDFATNRYMPEYNQVVNLAAVAAEYNSIPNPALYIDTENGSIAADGTIQDISGNNYPITAYNTSILDDGTIAFNIDNKSYLECGLDPNDSCWTAEIYFKLTELIDNQDMYIFNWGDTNNRVAIKYDFDKYCLDLNYNSAVAKDDFNKYIDYDTNTDYSEYIHIMLSYDGESIRGNMNGKNIIDYGVDPMPEIAKNIIIGKSDKSDEQFANMELKLFRFYNGVALNVYQMQCNYLNLIGR